MLNLERTRRLLSSMRDTLQQSADHAMSGDSKTVELFVLYCTELAAQLRETADMIEDLIQRTIERSRPS